MIEFEKPNIKCLEIDNDNNYAKFVCEPLERGYGITIGNSLRRILLSSLPGSAITGVKIEGVQHEFSTIPNVVEDVPEIKYMLGYVAKTTGFISPDEFIFEEDEQFAFESIMYSAMVLYNSKSASKEKLLEMHKKFTKEIEAKHEEKLSRTQDLITDKDQALKELGYAELNESNYSEVLEKIAEIQSRKI